MKFTDGYWALRPGVTLNSPVSAIEVRTDATSVTVYAPTKPIRHRGDTLNNPMLTFRFSSPAPDVIAVKAVHFAGRVPKGPRYEISEVAGHRVAIHESDDEVVLTSGKTSVRIAKTGDWAVTFFDGKRRLTGTGPRHTGHILDTDGKAYFREQLTLAVGESIYGLGERFTALVKNGQVVDLWNEDGGTCSEQAYKNIPFSLSSAGYGVWVNHSEKVSFEVASEVVSRIQFSIPGEELEYYFIGGGSMKQVLTNYTALSGRPALPPAWSFGLWLTTSFTTSYDEQTVNGFIDGMIERKVPLHVFHFDCFWMKEFQWCDFEWHADTFQDPVGQLKRIKDKGIHICVWINSYIGQKSRLFDEGRARGYLVKTADGSTWQWDRWQAGMGLVDFTNPGAVKWYQDSLRALIRTGVDCFKTDFGERIPTDVVWHDGSDPMKMHNYYTQLYNKAVFEVLEEEKGKNQALVFARSATAGGQKYPVHWLGLSGFGFWSHDISGFEKTATPDLYKRWAAFGLLSSHSRLHGNESYRVPWLFDEQAVDVLRHFVQLKCRLMPHLWAEAHRTVATGLPMARAIGESLLVAPIFREDGQVTYYVPAGRWTHYLDGRVVEGPAWRTETYDYFQLPFLVKPHTVLAVGANQEKTDYDFADGVTFEVFEAEEGKALETEVRASDSSLARAVRVVRAGNRLEARVSGPSRPWKVLVRGLTQVKACRGGTSVARPLGVLATADPGSEGLTIEW